MIRICLSEQVVADFHGKEGVPADFSFKSAPPKTKARESSHVFCLERKNLRPPQPASDTE
ncbi:hypothetical protein CH380_06825 [Leptospira adleri]|uniref:Uncharacterized protein n=1 Tax=Leptospira adleri TaxID=2023186 RepID=A0A2M9YRP1_9LEPT|nr:hypothetical protein CH380_06825 [Leptospira adleri]PJZ62371.1 hypothetical protein CH376_08435 [Leptospira adleri]